MRTSTTLRTVSVAGAVALAVLGGVAQAAPAAAAAPVVRPGTPVPAALQLPEGLKEVSRVLGVGVQVYDCTAESWVFREPRAALLKGASIKGVHFAGPTWRHRDGSSVTGTVVTRAPAPDPSRDIPLLLLRATPGPVAGKLAKVSYVARFDTRGGVAPAGACDAATRPVAEVPYASTYAFFAPRG